MSENRAYFDNNATTPIHPDALQVMYNVANNVHGNPSSSYAIGKDSRNVVENCRQVIAEKLHCFPSQIIFNSGASEGNNTVLKSILENNYSSRKEIVTSPVEHSSVRETMTFLRDHHGVRWRTCDVDKYGFFTFEDVSKATTRKTGIISLIYGNNELGTLMRDDDLRKIVQMCRSNRIHLHLDLTQCVGKIPINLTELGCDSAVISGHKFYAPKGIGALYIRDPSLSPVVPLVHGGVQEGGLRAGTENVVHVAAMATALEATLSTMDKDIARMKMLRDNCYNILKNNLGDRLRLFTHPEHNLPNTLSISIDGIDSRALLPVLDNHGYQLNVGSACSKGKRSATLMAIGATESQEKGALRISLGTGNTSHEVVGLCTILLSEI